MIYVPPFLFDLLKDEGLDLPEHVRAVKVVFPSDGRTPVLRLDVLLSPDDLGKIGRAIVRYGDVGDQGARPGRTAP